MTALQNPTDDDLNGNGVPPTLTIRVPRSVKGYFADGYEFVSTNTYCEVTAIAGALGLRLRGKATAAGTLSFAYRRPPGAGAGQGSGDSGTAYSSGLTPPHADVSVSADTEFLVNIVPGGEAYLAINWAPSGDGEWNFLDIFAQ